MDRIPAAQVNPRRIWRTSPRARAATRCHRLGRAADQLLGRRALLPSAVHEVYEHKNECRALEVIRHDWLSGGGLSPGLGAGAGCRKMRAERALCHSVRSAHSFRIVRSVWEIWKILSPWQGCDSEERSVVRELKG